MKYARIAAEVFNTPVLMEPSKLETIVSVLNSRMVGHELRDVSEQERKHAGYEVVKGVGIISVMGSLVHRGSWLGSWSGLTGYDFLSNALQTALEDDEVQRIALIMATHGGQANGLFDFADEVYEARKVKHITAIVSEAAYSAGYLIASAANEVVVTRTAGVGSVGVVIAHADYSKMDEKDGLKVTYIHSGAHKVDGNPHEPLSDSAKGRLQAESDQLYQLFIETVARNRGLSVEVVSSTEALTYTGQKGIDIGFADRISAERDELARLYSLSHGGSRQNSTTMKVHTMSDDKDLVGPTADEIAQQLKDAEAASFDLGMEEGTKRALAIMQAGAHAPVQAANFANNLKFTSDEAIEMLANVAPEKQGSLDDEMKDSNPNLGEDHDEDQTVTTAASWDTAFSNAKGVR